MGIDAGTVRATRRLVATALLMACILGCAPSRSGGRGPVVPPHGWFFSTYSGPVTQDFSGTPTGSHVKQVSEREAHYFRDFVFTGFSFAWDDVTITRIAREGGLKEIYYADYHFMSILNIFAVTTVRVYGS